MLKELRTQHRTILQMKFSGFTNNDIAEKTGMSPATISQIIRSPLGAAYLDGLQDRAKEDVLDVRKKLVSLNKDAIKTFERLINPATKAPHAVQYNTAKDILDRNGYKAPDKYVIDMTLATKTDEEIDAEINAIEASLSKTKNLPPSELSTQINDHIIPIMTFHNNDDNPNNSLSSSTDDEEHLIENDPFDDEELSIINTLPEDLLISTNK